MILLIDLCWKKDSLSKEEFVKPIEKIVRSTGREARIVHHLEINEDDISRSEKIILCGTALIDNEFLNYDFEWIKQARKPILGICAGMQAIAKAFGAEIIESKEIGMGQAECNDEIFGKNELNVYQLHGNSTTLPEGFEDIARNEKGIQAFKKGSIYGIQFHPEVRNESIITNWLSLP